MKIFLASPVLMLVLFAADAQTPMLLYPSGKIPNSKHAKDYVEKSEMEADGILIVSNVTEPSLAVYLPTQEKANGTAIIVFPGGGYSVLASGHEGADVAKAFNAMGVTAFVLKYRLPDKKIMINPEIGPLQDGLRAIQLVRSKAKGFGIDPAKIGIIGFSAGGHLASTVATKYADLPIANPEKINLRPDFVILGYPVISADTALWHQDSFKKLLGERASEAKLKEWSSELNVTDKTPPTFLFHASDDEAVKPENSIVYYKALHAHGVPAEMHLYQKGGHGYGLRYPIGAGQWIVEVENWLNSSGWIDSKYRRN